MRFTGFASKAAGLTSKIKFIVAIVVSVAAAFAAFSGEWDKHFGSNNSENLQA